MWLMTILAILVGIFEIRYAYKLVEKNKQIYFNVKTAIYTIGVLTILSGLVLFVLSYKDLFNL